MAKGIILNFRDRSRRDLSKFFHTMNERLQPDNSTPSPPYVFQGDGIYSFIYNPTPTVRYEKASFYLGVIIGSVSSKTFEPRSSRPDGTYALFQADDRYVEACTDFVALRTIWYYKSGDVFVASTSQRMIVAVLGEFFPDKQTVKWMLTSGTLGPSLSWDQRVHHLPANSSVLLDRTTWELIVDDKDRHMFFHEVPRTKEEHKTLLRNAVKESVEELSINPSQWTLALSGGMDSRSLLYHLKNAKGMNTVTWGVKDSMGKPGTDATIARQLPVFSANNVPLHVRETEPESFAGAGERAGEGGRTGY